MGCFCAHYRSVNRHGTAILKLDASAFLGRVPVENDRDTTPTEQARIKAVIGSFDRLSYFVDAILLPQAYGIGKSMPFHPDMERRDGETRVARNVTNGRFWVQDGLTERLRMRVARGRNETICDLQRQNRMVSLPVYQASPEELDYCMMRAIMTTDIQAAYILHCQDEEDAGNRAKDLQSRLGRRRVVKAIDMTDIEKAIRTLGQRFAPAGA